MSDSTADRPAPETLLSTAAGPVPGKPSGPTVSRIFLRGLALVLPPVLTLVILLWVLGMINDYIISPTTWVVRYGIARAIDESLPIGDSPLRRIEQPPSLPFVGTEYLVSDELYSRVNSLRERSARPAPVPPTPVDPATPEVEPGLETADDVVAASESTPGEVLDGMPLDGVYVPVGRRAVPYLDYELAARKLTEGEMPRTSVGIYMEVVTSKFFLGVFHLSLVAVLLLIAAIFFLGRLVTARLGSYFVKTFEHAIIGGLPLVRNVYGSVKQITDFLFTESTIEYRRVVAIEYPRKGIFSLGFVTGDSPRDVSAAAGEPCVTVLIPTSPMPMTGYTMALPRSSVIDLDLTIDQAIQFIVSCGVLVPVHQRSSTDKTAQAITAAVSQSGSAPATDAQG